MKRLMTDDNAARLGWTGLGSAWRDMAWQDRTRRGYIHIVEQGGKKNEDSNL